MVEHARLAKLLSTLTAFSFAVASLNGQQTDNKIDVKWGVADSVAVVGRLFRMHIPSDAFTGNVESYKVQGSDNSPLPGWLHFDSIDNVLQGLPGPSDVGQFYVDITAQNPTDHATVTSTILVRDVPSHTSNAPLRFKSSSGSEVVQCKEREPQTVATIIVDVNFDKLFVPDRLTLLKKFASHMNLHEEMIKMMPVGKSPLYDSTALVSGTGDIVTPKTSGLFISWAVGCGQVKEGQFPVLQKLDDDSTSGRMAKALGHSVIGWHVTNSHFQAPSRKRRQVHATPTPVVTPIIPTKTDAKQEKTDGTEDKMRHEVVVTQSPTFIHPTPTQPHMEKTDEPVLPPVKVDVEEKPAKIIPTETTTKVMPVSKTKKMPMVIPTKTYPSESTDTPRIDSGCLPGRKPEVKYHLQRQTYFVGEVIDYVIPEDTFEDCEVGGTRGLELMLFNETSAIVPSDFFLQFDSKKQKIFGLPLEKHPGKYKFNLIATKKSNSMIASTEFVIQIRPARNKRLINHELSVTIDYDFDKFMANVSDRIGLANRVASVYGDPDSKKLAVTQIKKGSVIYAWTNTSLSSRECPTQEITGLMRKLVNEDGTLNNNAVRKLKPFVLLSADAAPLGACEEDPDFPVIAKPSIVTTPSPAVEEEDVVKEGDDKVEEDDEAAEVTLKPDHEKESEIEVTKPATRPTTEDSVAKGAKGGDEDDIWITTVIPAVVIVVILLIALLIACILYRKKRKGKMNVEEPNTFVNKGAPVIFPDELEDKPSDVNKPLLLEGSPAPPQYRRGTGENPERFVDSNNRKNRSNLLSSPADDGITEMPEKPYEPPPPVTAHSSYKQPRTTHSQQPYSQPPQILP